MASDTANISFHRGTDSAAGGGFRTVIVGGGVAALEAVLALREALGPGPEIQLLAPNRELGFRPLAVAEPFGMGAPRKVSLDAVSGELGFIRREDVLARIEPGQRRLHTGAGAIVDYDALLIAIGARAETALSGALTYSGPESNEALRGVLDSLRAGRLRRLVFAVPPSARWPLPLYELAILSARHARAAGVEAEIAIATHEAEPLELFGKRSSEGIRQLLAIEAIELRTSAAPAAVSDGALRLVSGRTVAADTVISLPRFVAPLIPGLPQGPHGFVGTDAFMRVDGVERIWAAGDVTWFPIKQGGLAAQQADSAASSIAVCIDPSLEPRPFAPVLRGALLTGWTPHYLKAPINGGGGTAPDDSDAPLWWPPSKVAGRLLAPYLASRGDTGPLPPLADLDDERHPERADEHEEALELALTAADLDAGQSDYGGALRWLDVAEHLNVALPTDYARKRERWTVQQAMKAPPAPPLGRVGSRS